MGRIEDLKISKGRTQIRIILIFFRDLALQRISYLVIFIVSECKETLNVFNQCKCEITLLQPDMKRKHALNDPSTKCTYLYGINHN